MAHSVCSHLQAAFDVPDWHGTPCPYPLRALNPPTCNPPTRRRFLRTQPATVRTMWLRSLLLVAATAISMAANATLTRSRLRCEYLDNPVGIDETAPRLSWILTSSVKNQKQSSYRILVASTKAKVESGEGDLWDSGEVASDETIQIEYRGKALASRQRAWWTVSVKDTQGNEIKAAEPATWEMGLT